MTDTPQLVTDPVVLARFGSSAGTNAGPQPVTDADVLSRFSAASAGDQNTVTEIRPGKLISNEVAPDAGGAALYKDPMGQWQVADSSRHVVQWDPDNRQYAVYEKQIVTRPWELSDSFPARVAKSIWSGITSPRDAYLGRMEPGTEIPRALDMASVIAPGTIGARPAGILAETAGQRAARTAADLGAPLPRGIASDSTAVQAATQAARQLPVVGSKIDTRVGATVNAAGRSVNELADNLSGGVTDRASAGASLRPSLQGVIEQNNDTVDRVYGALRNVIDADEPSVLPETESALKKIVAARTAAGQRNPVAGLEDVKNLVDLGASFNGLQRARNDIGNAIDFGQANPGYNRGDLKRLYAAMSQDMDYVVRANANAGITGDAAARVLNAANGAAGNLIEQNKSLQRLLSIRSDESMVGSVVRTAQDRTGNARLLSDLRRSMPANDFAQIAGVGLSELGHNPATGEFSLNRFVTGWNKLGDRAKDILFKPQHRQALDDIAALGAHLKDVSQYENRSNTGRATLVGGLVGGVMAGGFHPLRLFTRVLPGYLLVNALAKPAVAVPMGRWAQAYRAMNIGQNPVTTATFNGATRNLAAALSDYTGSPVSPKAIMNLLPSPAGTRADAITDTDDDE